MKKKRLISFVLVLCLVFSFTAQLAFASTWFSGSYAAQIWFTNGNANFELLTNDGQTHNLKVLVTYIKNDAVVGQGPQDKSGVTSLNFSIAATFFDTVYANFYIDGQLRATLTEHM